MAPTRMPTSGERSNRPASVFGQARANPASPPRTTRAEKITARVKPRTASRDRGRYVSAESAAEAAGGPGTGCSVTAADGCVGAEELAVSAMGCSLIALEQASPLVRNAE